MQLMGQQKNPLVFKHQPQMTQVLHNDIKREIYLGFDSRSERCNIHFSVVHVSVLHHCFLSRLQSKNFPVGKGINRRFEGLEAQAGDTSWTSRR